jgi:hypothetical protein
MCSPSVGIGVRSRTASGPAMADRSSPRRTPRHNASVIEAQPQRNPHQHPAGNAFHDANHIGGDTARRHEVDQADRPVRGVPLGVQQQRVAAIAAPGGRGTGCGRKLPRARFVIAEHDSETRRRVKRGRQSQSMAPSRPASAAVCKSSDSA